jgi:hypothetical protein
MRCRPILQGKSFQNKRTLNNSVQNESTLGNTSVAISFIILSTAISIGRTHFFKRRESVKALIKRENSPSFLLLKEEANHSAVA